MFKVNELIASHHLEFLRKIKIFNLNNIFYSPASELVISTWIDIHQYQNYEYYLNIH